MDFTDAAEELRKLDKENEEREARFSAIYRAKFPPIIAEALIAQRREWSEGQGHSCICGNWIPAGGSCPSCRAMAQEPRDLNR
jgi:rubrerythrin